MHLSVAAERIEVLEQIEDTSSLFSDDLAVSMRTARAFAKLCYNYVLH